MDDSNVASLSQFPRTVGAGAVSTHRTPGGTHRWYVPAVPGPGSDGLDPIGFEPTTYYLEGKRSSN